METVCRDGASVKRESHGWPPAWPLDLFSSVRFGISLFTLLFVYCSIGSAVPAVRMLPGLEMTEFEWFHWWPFNVLIILLCLNLTIATVRRIPLRVVNAGSWMIHTGIIILAIGSYYYFGTKVEGDAPVFRRCVGIEIPGTDERQTLVALPGNETSVIVGSNEWNFQVKSTDSARPILSGEHKSETAYAVDVAVTPPTGEPFVRRLLAGYPQYTEDVIPREDRSVESIGRESVNQDIEMLLEYEPTSHFHVADTWALFMRRVGETEWVERPIEGLPRYNDRVGSRDQVFTDPHFPVDLRSLDLEVPPGSKPDVLGNASVRITGYLRYARMRRRWRDGGDRLNPVLRFSVLSGHARAESRELIALDRMRNHSEDGIVRFRWFDDRSMVDSLPTGAQAKLRVAVPGANVEFDVPIAPGAIAGHTGPFTPIEGTDFSYRVLNIRDDLIVPSTGSTVSVAMVEIKTPQEQFTRMVADQPEMTRDMHGGEGDPHSPRAKTPGEADPRIRMTYQPRSAPLVFAAYPGGLYLAHNGELDRNFGREIQIGEPVEIVPGLSVKADALWAHAVAEVKPYIVPPQSRRSDAGETFAMIRLEVDTGSGVRAEWVRFSHYVFPNKEYAYSGRFAYAPRRFRLPDGDFAEVVFSRERRSLPNPIALEEFALDTHVGGYTGSTSTIRNYVSRLRFLDNGKWTDPPVTVKVNAPTEYGGYWYYQSTWDRPPSGSPGGGMNYTGLGIGNRNGVYVQLVGCCISAVGMLFAFYIKPIVKRGAPVSNRCNGRRIRS